MYNFDELITRRGTNSLKWDSAGHADVLPMWVADMDFRTAPVLIEALRRRVEHGIFGYTQVPPTYYEAVAAWFARRHGWNLQPEWIMYTSGVVPALSAIIKALTVPGDKVIAQTPVYNCFFSSIRNNGCELLANPLRRENDTYRMDFDDLERKAADPRAKLLLLCNPHNPAGRVWTREELTRLNDICLRHGVRVVADEIHCELVFSGHTYTPFASVSTECLNNSITCVSPSKAFNIAGLQIASIISSDADIRARIERAININEVCDVNPFGVIATEAAYSAEGEEWLLQLIAYLEENDRAFHAFCAEHLPQFPLTRQEGTYLEWMDCTALHLSSGKLEHVLLEKAQLWLNAGTMYGSEGEGYMRWNIACPRSRMLEGLERFAEFLQK